MYKIKWINRISGETGFVESVDTTKKHFINTYNFENAKSYNKGNATKVIMCLNKYGEGLNNDFELIEA